MDLSEKRQANKKNNKNREWKKVSLIKSPLLSCRHVIVSQLIFDLRANTPKKKPFKIFPNICFSSPLRSVFVQNEFFHGENGKKNPTFILRNQLNNLSDIKYPILFLNSIYSKWIEKMYSFVSPNSFIIFIFVRK